uniref:lysidine synthase n=1 Tax=Catenella fusiformis TaxID=3024791 RepID=UPI0027DA70D5|nr:lysidine synthase [Catenella fusiformis]WCH57468.1 lysidine synthase [Catenella fusiformis]
METYLHTKFYDTINKLLKNNSFASTLIAISGGQDSLCLTKLVKDFNDKHHLLPRLTYIYIDHQWRKDSRSQIKHLINIIKKNKQKIIIYQIKQIVKSEIQARQLRYKILIKHAILNKYSTIMTAHTETDKIETFWLQIFKGTSLDGITSLNKKRKSSSKICIYRPLLNFTRSEICWFCRKFYLPIWSDITNYQHTTHRNRLRNELIPYINRYFSRNIEKKLIKFIATSSLDNEYIKQNAIKLYLKSRHKISVALNFNLLREQHIALQIRTLQIFFFITQIKH